MIKNLGGNLDSENILKDKNALATIHQYYNALDVLITDSKDSVNCLDTLRSRIATVGEVGWQALFRTSREDLKIQGCSGDWIGIVFGFEPTKEDQGCCVLHKSFDSDEWRWH